MTPRTSLTTVLALLAALLLLLTACGAEPYTREGLVQELRDLGRPPATAECAADAVFDGGLSPEGLKVVYDGVDERFDSAELSEQDRAAWHRILDAMAECE